MSKRELTEGQRRLRKALYESAAIEYRCECLEAMGEQDIDRHDIVRVLRRGTFVRSEINPAYETEILTVAGVSLDGMSLEVSACFEGLRIYVVSAETVSRAED